LTGTSVEESERCENGAGTNASTSTCDRGKRIIDKERDKNCLDMVVLVLLYMMDALQ